LRPFPTAQAAEEVRQRRNGEQEDRRNESDQPPERDLPELRRFFRLVKILVLDALS
jgi:hypothetical protein